MDAKDVILALEKTPILTLTDDDAGDVELDFGQNVVRTITGATADIDVKLPKVESVPDNVLVLYQVFMVADGGKDTTIDDHDESEVAFAAVTLTDAGDYWMGFKSAVGWHTLYSKIGGTVAPA